jgi:rhodanese-related sulfurtransferase
MCANPKLSADNTLNKKKPVLTRPFCGVYCIYAATKLSGKQVDFTDLLQSKYISSPKGSSMSELEQAARDRGLLVEPIEKMSSLDLQNCGHYVILHVKSDSMSKRYDHYVLFLGMKKGRARLFDPPSSITVLPFRELTLLWDGNGLIVSTEPIDLSSIFAPTRKRFAMYVAAAIALILTLHWAKRWLPKAMLNSRGKLFGLSIGQGAVFAIVALLCGMLYHFANDEGLLANPDATTSIQQAHQGNFIPKITERKVHKLLNSDTVFIDARFARDYKAGHIEGAISTPVDANDVERQKVTADIVKDARIVMYCQSSKCKYAEIVAIKLIDDGFSNISIFKGGWAEWVEKNGKNKKDETS